ncbi:MAG: alcohol dehydrogenase catalytic domain-containing protein [Planctomycetes bacterium]|nr:alcohol dehydrogenase catalytic domain-containing protein [Planctomycetota bacterium]
MRQAVMTKPKVIEFHQVPSPVPGAGQVLLRIKRIGICGSDVHVYHGKHPFTPYPVVQGHEFSAVVEAVGPGVSGIDVGSKATAIPQETCGRCRPCRRGQYNVCEVLKVRGFQAPGVAQDLYSVEASKIVPLPGSFTPEQGAFVEPVAVATHSTGRAGDMKGKNVVVLGAGPIGNLTAQACLCRGAGKVLITDLSDYRLEVARRVGIANTSNALGETLAKASARVFGEDGFDLAFEAVGVEGTMDQAIASIGKGGTIVVLGVFSERPRIDMACVGEHELTLVGTLMYRREDYLQAVEWIDQGLIQTAPLDSKHFPFEQYLHAYEFIDREGAKSMKVFIDL